MERTVLILARHGETSWNKEHRFQGQRDAPLSELGKLQAMALHERLKDEPIDAVYTSDLSRAFETAQLILRGRDTCINPTPELRERHMGAWEGLTFDEAMKAYPEEVKKWLKEPLATVPLGEDGTHFVQRVTKFFERLLNMHSGERILVVSHAGPIKVAICSLLNWDMSCLRHFRISNGSISVIEVGRRGALCSTLNDECHLIKLNRALTQARQCGSPDQHK
ncbi:MAG: hypothetical protein GDYSWBUE_001018 [Candidatus Fervidibacterota bacterium]